MQWAFCFLWCLLCFCPSSSKVVKILKEIQTFHKISLLQKMFLWVYTFYLASGSSKDLKPLARTIHNANPNCDVKSVWFRHKTRYFSWRWLRYEDFADHKSLVRNKHELINFIKKCQTLLMLLSPCQRISIEANPGFLHYNHKTTCSILFLHVKHKKYFPNLSTLFFW